MGIFKLIFFILELVTAWKVFEKYGEPGWKGIIPIYSDFVEFSKVWSASVGIAYGVLTVVTAIPTGEDTSLLLSIIIAIAGIAYFIMSIIFSNKKAKAFGKGIGFTILLILFPFIGNLIIGFSNDVVYRGNQA